jgi:hypothetical protein
MDKLKTQVQNECPQTNTNPGSKRVVWSKRRWPTQCSVDEPVIDGLNYSFDFYVPAENTVIEIALSIRNIVTEFEKDVFKAILSKANGKRIKKLILIGKSGSVKRQDQSGPNAIKAWVRKHCGIIIEVKELE